MGSITPFQKILINEVLKHIDDMTERIEQMSEIIEARMRKYVNEIDKLIKMPEIGKTSAQIILAEIGQDMSRFPTEAHISSWCGLCPGNNESAGKRRSGKTRKRKQNFKINISSMCKISCKK